MAQAAGWKSAQQPGQWVKVERTFRDGSKQTWWALEVQVGPYGPEKTERAVISSQLVEGRYPAYQEVFPKKQTVKVPLVFTIQAVSSACPFRNSWR